MAETARPQPSPKPRRRWPWVVLSLAVFCAVVLVLLDVEDTADVRKSKTPAPAPLVTVIEVAPAQAEAVISVFAELKPRWDAQIRAAVSGRIIAVHDAALAGTRVAKGTPLFAIRRTPFETAVAEAEMAVEQARLTLMQARNQVAIAERQFERDATDPPNELALKLPQRRIAERGLVAAQAQLETARRQLADTRVTAPFSGFVTNRLASLGQTVSAGEPLLHLSDDHQFELTANLSQAQWAMLQHPVAGGSAQLFHRDGNAIGQARIRQGGGFLDPETRQVRVFLDVAGTDTAVLSGDFLRVVFTGRPIDNTLTLPDGALSQSGHLWLVDAASTLQRHRPHILFRQDASITIAAPAGTGPWRVAKSPLASFLPGQKVRPARQED